PGRVGARRGARGRSGASGREAGQRPGRPEPGAARPPVPAGFRARQGSRAAVGLAGTVTAAILLYPGSGEPGQASGARTASTAATQATSPGAPAPGSGEAAREPAGGR